ncbi:glycerol-3-phosphate acyltransferase [Chloroflexota bacterium]
MIFNTIIAIVIGYLLGSIPSAYIAGRLKKGVDIRQLGGGNMGALNTMRKIGIAAGLIVLFADIAKGALAVLIAQWLGLPLIWTLVVGFVAITGHNWPVFLKFKGGKGAATALGVLLVLVPREFAISLAIIAIVIVVTNNIRLAIAVGLAFLPLFIWLFNDSVMLIFYALAISFFLAIRIIIGSAESLTAADKKKGLIFDREYHFWQTRR